MDFCPLTSLSEILLVQISIGKTDTSYYLLLHTGMVGFCPDIFIFIRCVVLNLIYYLFMALGPCLLLISWGLQFAFYVHTILVISARHISTMSPSDTVFVDSIVDQHSFPPYYHCFPTSIGFSFALIWHILDCLVLYSAPIALEVRFYCLVLCLFLLFFQITRTSLSYFFVINIV